MNKSENKFKTLNKIYHLVSFDRLTGGAQVAYLWHKALLNEGIESYFFYKGGYKLQEKIKNEKNTIAYFNIFDKVLKILKIPKNSFVIAHLSEDHWLSFFLKKREKRIIVFHNKKTLRNDIFHKLIYKKKQKVIFAYNLKEKPNFNKYKVFLPVYDQKIFYQGNQPNEILNICTIGKLEKEREHHKFLFLCNEIKKLNFPFKGYVIGKGKYLQNLKKLKDDLNLKEIEFLGYFEDEELAKILRKMDFLVWTSPGSQQSHRALLEGILCGAVACSFEMEGIEFWIENGKTGIIISKNLNSSAIEIIETFKDKEKYKKLRENSYKEALKKMNQENFSLEFLKFLYEDTSGSP